MRYWVYKDAQILGPVDREQLASAVGLRADTLVCEETAGSAEINWRCAEEFPELSGLYYSSVSAPPLDMPVEEYGLLERLQFESAGTAQGEDWLGALFSPSAPSAQIGATPGVGKLADLLKQSEDRVKELTDQLASLSRRLEELEGRPAAKPAATMPASELPTGFPSAGELAPAPAAEPAAEELPAIPSLAPAVEAAAPLPEAPAALPEPEPEVPAEPDNPNRLKLGAPVKKGVQLGAAKSFKTVKKDAPAAELPAAAAPPPAPLFVPPPASAPIPALQPAPATPGLPTPVEAAAPPPVTGWSTPSAATPIFGAQQPAPLEAPPIPSGSMNTPAAIFTQAQNAPPIPDTQPPQTLVGAGAGAGAQTPGPATKEVLARLAKPQDKPSAQPTAVPKPRSNKTFIIIGAVGIVVVGLLGWLFLRNPEEVKTAVDMEPETPVGLQTPAEPAPAQQPQPMYQIQPPAQPEAAPPAAPEPPQFDPREAAIELVKTYPLDNEQGTIGNWLQWSYMQSQETTDKWDAGAVEETAYMVQYTVQPKAREAITYLFEADVARGTVAGKNPQARQLLAGGPPKEKPALKKPARRRARKAAAKPEPPKELPQLPLPSDAELLPPSDDSGEFGSDAIQSGL